MRNREAPTIRLASAAKLSTQRWLSLGGFTLALAALILSSIYFVRARQNEAQSQIDLAIAETEVGVARDRQALAEKNRVKHEALSVLANSANSLGLAPTQWSERNINLHEQRYQRQEANELLHSTASGKGRLFAVEVFDIGVTDSAEALFQLPSGKPQDLRFSLRGNALFSTKGND